MATEIVMPKLGLTMESGIISSWLVAEGDEVKKGQALLEIDTDKVTMEVEAQADGILRKILVSAGVDIPVSQAIGVIAAADEDVSAYETLADPAAPAVPTTPVAPTGPPVPAVPSPAPVIPSSPHPSASTNGRRPYRASPKARKIAQEQGLDLSNIQGSGPSGRIVSKDILEAPAPAPVLAPSMVEAPAVAAQGQVDLSRAEQVAAERLTASYQQIPHIHISMDVSAVWLQQFREGYKLEGKKISFNDLIVKATARVLSEYPRVNSFDTSDGFSYATEINIGIAVSATGGLVVPVIRRVDTRSVEEIAMEGARLVDAARHGRLSPDDMMGGTFTISNLGMFGVSRFTAIINPPQVAILAVGAIENRVVASGSDSFAVRPQLTLNMAADHRVVDGALAAQFLGRLKEVLETPGLLG